MKKPSKLLSLFLAFVMLLTSLSVGLTALAKEWSGSVTVNGANVTDQIDAIAHALWGADGDNGNFSSIATWSGDHYVNTVDNDPTYPDDWNGNHLFDNANGDMYTAVKNAWDVVFNVQDIVGKTSGTNNQINNTIGTVLKNAIQGYMGDDFQAAWGNTGNNTILYGWFGLGGGFEGTNASGGNNKSYNVYISLDPEYYAWNQFMDEDGNVDLESIPNKIISERTFYWHSPNPGGTSPANQYNYADTALHDQGSDAVLVNIDEIKAFNELFSDGENNYWEDFINGEFDNIPDAVQTAILNGAIATYKEIQTNETQEWHEAQRGGGDFNHDVFTSHEATKIIFDNYFCTEEEFFGEGFSDGGFNNDDIDENSYYYEFLKYLVEKFTKAVYAIEETYFSSGSIDSDLSLEELTALKSLIDNAYNIWNGLPASLLYLAETEKGMLDDFYYKDSDTAANITSFVPAWNTANAQAYIDAVEELEFASGYVDGVFTEEYIIESKAEAERVKNLLAAAEEAYGNLLWEASYEDTAEKEGNPAFEDITVIGDALEYVSPQNGYTITGGLTVFTYATKVYSEAYLAYMEYLYRQFIEIAYKNLSEYIEGIVDGKVKGDGTERIKEEDLEFTILDIVPVNSKINRVSAAYELLDENFRARLDVVFYMEVIAKLKEALDNSNIENGAWERYEIDSPYYYNWDEKDKSAKAEDAQAVIDALDALLGSEQLNQLLGQLLGADSLADFATGTIESVIVDNANSIIQAILNMVMPMIQDAMADARVDNDTVLVIHTDILSAKRNNGVLTPNNPSQLTMTVMFPDPMDLVSRIQHYTSNPNTIAAANKIAEAVYEWDDVDWEAVDWKLELADDPVDEFCNIVGGILECISKLVNSLLFNIQAVADLGGSCAGIAEGMADTTISQYYNAGYEKDILPFLELLGCEGLETTATLTSWAKSNNKWADIIKAILNPLLNRVEDLLSGDVASNILGILPNLAYLLTWDMIVGTSPDIDGSYAGGDGWIRHAGSNNNKEHFEAATGYAGVKDLIAPLSKFAGLSLEGFGITSLDGAFLMDTINGFLADMGFELPDINWAMIAGMGEMNENASSIRTGGKRKTIEANPDEILIFFLNYITEVLVLNKDAVHDLLAGLLPEGNAEIAALFEQLFAGLMATADDPRAFGAAVFEIFRGVEGMPTDWTDINNWDWAKSLVDYTDLRYDEAYVTESIDKLADIVDRVLAEFVFSEDAATITELLASKDVFSGKIINTLFKTIYSLDSDMIRTVLSLVQVDDGTDTYGVDISPANLAAVLAAAGYTDVAEKIADLDYYSWAVGTGEYEITCTNTVGEGEDEKDCGTVISVPEAADGSITCPECGETVEYKADDVRELTEKQDIFGEITDEMWNVNDADSFRKALVTILDPFKYIIGAVLAGEGATVSVAYIVNVIGDNGYENVIKPLLAVCEAYGATLPSDVTLENALDSVLTMVFDLVDAIGADPVNTLIGVIPQLAAFIDNGGLQNLVTYIIHPLWNVTSGILDLFQINNDIVPETDSNRIYNDYLIDIVSGFIDDDSPLKLLLDIDNIQDNLFVIINSFLENIISVGDDKYSIVIPDIDWHDLAGSGEKGASYIVADNASVVVKVLRYIWSVVLANEGTIDAVLNDKVGEGWATINKYISIGNFDEDDFVYLVLTLVHALDSSWYDSTDIWDEILNAVYSSATKVKYPVDENGKAYTPADVDDLVQFISDLALKVVENYIEGFDFEQLGGSVYNSVIPSLLASAVLPLLESNADAFGLLGMSYDYDALLAALEAADYVEVLDAINAQGVSALADIDWTAISDENLFGITNAEEFTLAVATILEPFMPFLNFILNSGEIVVLNVVPFIGANGYANALYPLLVTLGIDAVDAETYAADAESDPKNLLVNIIDPLFAWLNNALFIAEDADGPVGALIGRLPDIAKFLDQGGLQQFIGDIFFPFVNVLNTLVDILTNGEQDNIFDLLLTVISDMAKEATGEEEQSFLDKILGMIFGEKEADKVTWANLHEHVFDLAAMILNIVDIGATAEVDKDGNLVLHISVNGNPMTIVVPKYDLAKLAGVDGSDEVKKTTDSLLLVLQYFWDGLLNNKETFASVSTLLADLIGDTYFTNVADATLGTYIENLLSSQANEIVAALIQTKEALDSSDHVADWSFLFKNYKATGYNYPKGVTSEDIEEVIEILTTAIENALDIFFNSDLPSLATNLVYTSDIVEAVKGVVNSLATNETVQTVFGLLGLEIAENTKTYKVTDKASFAAALADVLAPFEPLTDVLLNSGTINVADLVEITGANGFNNAVKPFLEYALGCTVTDSSFKGIITAVLDRVEKILADPINELVDVLPLLANFIDKGGVQYFVEELLYPIVNLTSPILGLITDDSLFDFAFKLLGLDLTWGNLQNELASFATSQLTNIKINGKTYSITVPEIKWSKLAGCGKLAGTSIEANTADVLMTVLDYIFRLLDANKNVVFDLVGNNATIKEIISNLLELGAGGTAKIIVTVLLKMDTYDNVTWTFKNIKPVTTTYTPGYTDEEYHNMIMPQIDDAIFGLIAGLVDIDIPGLLNNLVYKNSIVNTVAKLVYTNLEKIKVAGFDIHTLLKAIDLDITTANAAKLLSDFSSASREIGSKATWAEVNFDAINWNFEDGDKEGFVNALAAALRPIQPLIQVILSGDDLIVLGSITVKGGDGYNTAVIPLFEALGVSPVDLVSPQQFAKEANTDKVLTSVLMPLLDRAEVLLAKPILTLCETLPNVAYFLLNGGARDLVENIAGPVLQILDEIAPIYDLDLNKILKDAIGFGLSDLENLDLADLVNTVLSKIKINGQELKIRITEIDLETLAGRGELVTYRSARTYNGSQMDCKKIEADAAAVFVSVLRYIVHNLQENLDEIVSLLEGLGLSGDIANMINQILEMLTSMDVDGVIDALLELLFPKDGTNGTDSNGAFSIRSQVVPHYAIWSSAALFMLLIFLATLAKKKKEEDPVADVVE